jgi:hypothetical protein
VYLSFEQELARRGCAALGYRLTGDEPLSSLCVKHLRGTDRVVVAFTGVEAWVILVGPHVDGDRAADVYAALYALADVSPPTQARSKPPCCHDEAPPNLDEVVIHDLVRRVREMRRSGRTQ